MERIKELDRYQKGILLVLTAMLLIFAVVYFSVSSRVGYLYQNVILEPSDRNGDTVYAGKLYDRECAFTVSADKTVTFQWGDKIYGPYTAKEDPTARPEDQEYLTGVEIRDGEAVFFRGGVWKSEDGLTLFGEDGGITLAITVYTEYGTAYDADGNVIDPMEPSPMAILELMDGPELTSKGAWGIWFMGLVFSVFTAVSVLFADELFRFGLTFRIRDAEYAEPSDWELAGRYIGWTILTGMTLVLYLKGLQ